MGAGFGAFVILLGIALLALIGACIPVPNRRARMVYLVGYLAAVVAFVIWAAGQGMPIAMAVVFLGPGVVVVLIRLYFAVAAAIRKA